MPGKYKIVFYLKGINNLKGCAMSEGISKLIEEYKSTKKSLECGLKWLPTNEAARSKIDVINMIISDLEQLESQCR
ncbi:hypothetical protein ATN24_10360 [Clostridium butyricum]|jgi:hypothetical protein|nr:hypothetical protein [Clostridium butyricum]KJZ85460.1 hypothetical protein ClosIBUN22A_CONTIG76g01744 [Clostridium sp. IBUN22A]KJZ85831.1 hypothetical protein ClosIBUN125C_CONTIG46g02741 [Clostridium sp. IBUN125C]KJZ95276.1 hypothetical protein ClosIBUN62F_CONTIG17g00863 [Clostridium sp. IBUN62F]KJZ97541.1 hypothetical protein ClosIBUN13A_CONTIG114g01680 [Clostridium sp. IBUN13A]ALP90524.1 hypothetical protein ATN24_10360 [Clostridium butyricum]